MKLTKEEKRKLCEDWANSGGLHGDLINMVEAEVLRLNGIGDGMEEEISETDIMRMAVHFGLDSTRLSTVLDFSRALIRRAATPPQQQQAAPVPDGFVLVPVAATKEMCKAAVIFANGNAVYKNVAAGALEIEEQIYGEAYAAMLSAAPKLG